MVILALGSCHRIRAANGTVSFTYRRAQSIQSDVSLRVMHELTRIPTTLRHPWCDLGFELGTVHALSSSKPRPLQSFNMGRSQQETPSANAKVAAYVLRMFTRTTLLSQYSRLLTAVADYSYHYRCFPADRGD